MPGPVQQLRVIDLTSGPVGGVATMVLADFGADVVKVEHPGGDPFRFLASAPVWLRGKRSVVLDLKTEAGRADLARLAARTDLVLTTGTEARLRRLGADHDTLAAANPAIVTCAITAFGPTGPYAEYPGYEGVVAAKAGRMASFAGLVHREGPQFAALRVASHHTALAAVFGSLAALIARDRTGRGQRVDTSLLQGLTAYDLVSLMQETLRERDPERWTEPVIPPPLMPTINYHPIMTKDGVWLQLGNLLQHLFDNFLVAADLADIYADGEHEGSPATWPEATREAFRDRMLLHMRERTAEEWMRTFIDHGGVAAHRYQSTQEALDDPDLTANGHVVTSPHPYDASKPPMRQIGVLARLTGTPGAVRAAVPSVGEHTAEVLGSLPAAPAVHPDAVAPAQATPPLDGITVLDFSTIIAAPLAATHLADLGARVIKMEQVGGDPWRWMYQGLGFAKTNAGKESIALDLKSAEGRAIAHALIARADVLIHNYRPGVPERLGIGYEDARAIRPDIVYVSANGYGLAGPGAHRPATHPIAGAAAGGAVWQSGGMPAGTSLEELREGARRLSRANEVNPDPNTSAVIATATMLALWHRHRTGEGQQLFTDMMGASVYANIDDFFSYEGRAPRPPVDPEITGTGPLYRLYRCHEGWVFLGVVLDREWDALCAAIGRPDLRAHPDYATRESREAHGDALAAALAEVFATRDAYWWEASLTAKGIGCVRADGPLPGEFWRLDPHVAANAFTTTVTHFEHGPYERYRGIVRVRDTDRAYGPAPVGGEHAAALLRELGYDDAAIAALRAAGVVWSEPQVLERGP